MDLLGEVAWLEKFFMHFSVLIMDQLYFTKYLVFLHKFMLDLQPGDNFPLLG